MPAGVSALLKKWNGVDVMRNKIVSSDRSSYSDDVLVYIQWHPLFEIFTQSIEAIDVTSVTLLDLVA